MTKTEHEYWNVLENDPGNPEFVDYAALLRDKGRSEEAMDVCLAGLSKNPSCHPGRLILARIMVDRGFLPFAVREIEVLHKELPENVWIRSLLEKLGGHSECDASLAANVRGGEETLAEAELDIEEIDAAGEEIEKS